MSTFLLPIFVNYLETCKLRYVLCIDIKGYPIKCYVLVLNLGFAAPIIFTIHLLIKLLELILIFFSHHMTVNVVQ